MLNVKRLNAAVNERAPCRSRPMASGSRLSRKLARPNAIASAPITALVANTLRHPKLSIRNPARIGPNAKPTPNVVPSRLNARTRTWPSNSCASAAAPPAKAAAEASPWAARNRSSARMFGAKLRAIDKATKAMTPESNTRLRQYWSASAPAAIWAPPKVSMKALVIQVSAAGSALMSRPCACGLRLRRPKRLSGLVNDTDEATAPLRACPGRHP